MSTSPAMHANELRIDRALVRRMVAERFPHWAALRVDLVVRIPRIPEAAEDIEKEHTWLGRLAPELPVAVPAPVGLGAPVDGCPWPWSVLRWLDGTNPAAGTGSGALAADLASFVTALHRVDPAGGPASYRSEPLADRDGAVRRAIAALAPAVDAGAVTSAWEASLRAPAHPGPPVWIHADLQPGKLLVDGSGRLGAVIDFGCAGLGDPAVDLIPAWYVLGPTARDTFRAAVGADPAAWARGRGWALSVALTELEYYRCTDRRMADTARHVIAEVLAERDG
ncbi:aminoglycoside phosphotransferase family protein [Kitasatospora sp. NPDC048194]|uniref:aminoglycoside phosphotransferase family protein n=1 Tax=Kitasatospora sp. NPDC048194 TaxID=3364045 RepID=UPI00371AC79C